MGTIADWHMLQGSLQSLMECDDIGIVSSLCRGYSSPATSRVLLKEMRKAGLQVHLGQAHGSVKGHV